MGLRLLVTKYSSASFTLQSIGDYNFYMNGDLIEIKAFGTKLIHVITNDAQKVNKLLFQMLNGIIGYKETMDKSFIVEMSEYERIKISPF